MTTHLLRGRQNDDLTITVESFITVCCSVHTLGLRNPDNGTINPSACDCPSYSPEPPVTEQGD